MQFLGYTAIFRGFITQSVNHGGIYVELSARGFPRGLSLVANQQDFKNLAPSDRRRRVGIVDVALPQFVFEAYLEPTPPHAAKSREYILLGANSPKELLELVVACGFTVQ
jgi:hypothetical protein